jgi:hypothetical protein
LKLLAILILSSTLEDSLGCIQKHSLQYIQMELNVSMACCATVPFSSSYSNHHGKQEHTTVI